MTNRSVGFVLATVLFIAASPAGTARGQQVQPVGRAFEHYERIRAALGQDTTEDIAGDANALSPLARDIAGDDASRAATLLANAKDIDGAREHFGSLSQALVPKFLEAGLPGVQGFVCSMKQKPWAQRGSTAENPYFGKAMAACGTPIT